MFLGTNLSMFIVFANHSIENKHKPFSTYFTINVVLKGVERDPLWLSPRDVLVFPQQCSWVIVDGGSPVLILSTLSQHKQCPERSKAISIQQDETSPQNVLLWSGWIPPECSKDSISEKQDGHGEWKKTARPSAGGRVTHRRTAEHGPWFSPASGGKTRQFMNLLKLVSNSVI